MVQKKKENKCQCSSKECDCSSKGCQCADQACLIQQRIFEREVDEELRQEQLRNLWKKYRFFVFGLVIAIILGTIATEWYQDYRIKVRTAESDRYENAVLMSVTGQKEKALSDLAQLSEDGKTGYRYVAQLEQADIYFQNNQIAEGLAALKKVADDSSAPKALRHAATLIYVGKQADTGNTAELKEMLSDILADQKSPFFASASELMAVLQIISGEKKEAVDTLEKALMMPSLTPQLKERMTTVLKEIKK